MKLFLLLFCFMITVRLNGQPNCNVYKLDNNESCYKSCILATEASINQGTRESQIKFDEAIKLCPSLAYAYFEKSVPYLKRGELSKWKVLIDQAVELDPVTYLGYRGWCRFQFVRDYNGAMNDLNRLSEVAGGEIGYSQNGDYHLEIVKALCLKKKGKLREAIALIENQLLKKDYTPGPYDYLHLGILYFELKENSKAMQYLLKETQANEFLADTYYYIGLVHYELRDMHQYQQAISKSRDLYLKGHKRFDFYTHPIDKVYLEDIESEMRKITNAN